MKINELPEKMRLEISKEDLKEFAHFLLEQAEANKPDEEQVPQILTMDDAVKFTHHAKPTLYSLTSKRLIPHFKRGKRILFKRTELEEWMLSEKKQTAKEYQQSLDAKRRKL
jgi:excisionase family DNA binding protein